MLLLCRRRSGGGWTSNNNNNIKEENILAIQCIDIFRKRWHKFLSLASRQGTLLYLGFLFIINNNNNKEVHYCTFDCMRETIKVWSNFTS